jgi:hypothetical protein
MFFLEREMKGLKIFFQQRGKVDGSMVVGYMVCESYYYVSTSNKLTMH